MLADGGATSLLDVRQAEQLVFGASATIPDLESRIEQQENFISILVGRLPEEQRQRGRVLGLALAMGTRILLLLLLTWIMKLQATLFSVVNVDISGRDLILIGGGLFLLAKATLEIHAKLEGEDGEFKGSLTGWEWAEKVAEQDDKLQEEGRRRRQELERKGGQKPDRIA